MSLFYEGHTHRHVGYTRNAFSLTYYSTFKEYLLIFNDKIQRNAN